MSVNKFSEIEGKGVISSDGREIGELADMVVDDDSWTVVKLVVRLERELLESFHMKRPMFGTQTIQLPTSYVSGVGDKLLLNKRLEELTEASRDAAESEG